MSSEKKEKTIFADIIISLTISLNKNTNEYIVIDPSSTSVVPTIIWWIWFRTISMFFILCQHGVGGPNFSPAHFTMRSFQIYRGIFISSPPVQRQNNISFSNHTSELYRYNSILQSTNTRGIQIAAKYTQNYWLNNSIAELRVSNVKNEFSHYSTSPLCSHNNLTSLFLKYP